MDFSHQSFNVMMPEFGFERLDRDVVGADEFGDGFIEACLEAAKSIKRMLRVFDLSNRRYTGEVMLE